MQDFDDVENRLWRSLMRLNGALPRLLEEDLVRSGLSLSEFGVLLTLSESEGGARRMSDLALACGLSPSRVTRVVTDLQRRELVDKVRSDDDARGNTASITDEGRKWIRAAYPVQVDRARSLLFDHLDPAERDTIADALESLLRRVTEESRLRH